MTASTAPLRTPKPARHPWHRFVAAGFLLGSMGCATVSNPSNSDPAGKPTVVASYSVLCDLTQTIAGETINLHCSIDRNQDPHTYTATPQDRQLLEKAELILYGGYGFDPAVARLIEATQNRAPKIAVNEEAVPNPLQGHHHSDKEDETHSRKPEAIEPDPHIWHDVKHAIAMTRAIRDRLRSANPQQAQLYAKNAEQLIQDLEQLDRWIRAQIATIPEGKRILVTTHDALGYYAEAYNIDVLSLQGLSSDEQPTPSRVRELIETVRQTEVPTIFVELTANNKILETVAREAGVKLSPRPLISDGLGEKESETGTYIGMMKNNTCAIVDGLGGRCQP